MRFPVSHFKKLALLMLIPLLAQCSNKKSRSSATQFDVLPQEPIVILGNTKDSAGQDVQGPWFNFRVNVTNNDDTDPITIVALVLEITGMDENGSPIKKDTSFDPSKFDFQYSDSITCKYFTFGSIPAHTTAALSLSSSVSTNCNGSPVFTVGSNPGGINGKSFRYRVKVRPMGWFGTYDEPTDRFDTFFTFYTR